MDAKVEQKGPRRKAVRPPAAASAATDSAPPRPRWWSRLDGRLVAVAALSGVATLYGLTLDRSIRSDPFDGPASPWEWLMTRQPAPELATIRVVPAGWRGELTWRPTETGWLSDPRALEALAAASKSGQLSDAVLASQAQAAEAAAADAAAAPAAPPVDASSPPPEPSKLRWNAGEPPAGLVKLAFGEVPPPQAQRPLADYGGGKEPLDVRQAQGTAPPVQRTPTTPSRRTPPRAAAETAPEPSKAPPSTAEPPPADSPAAPDSGSAETRPRADAPPPAAAAALPVDGGPFQVAGCSFDGKVCVVTDGAGFSAYSPNGGRRFYPLQLRIQAQPAPVVAKTASGWYLVHAISDSEFPEILGPRPFQICISSGALPARIRRTDLAPDASPEPQCPDTRAAPALISETVSSGEQLVSVGGDNPLLAFMPDAAEAGLLRSACFAYPAADDEPADAERVVCAALFPGGDVRILRTGGDRPTNGMEAHTLAARGSLRSVFFVSETRGYISTEPRGDGDRRSEIFETRDGGDSWRPLKYAALPAPWTYATGAVFLFSLVGAAGGVLRRREETLEGIETRGVSDQPITWADPDPLDLKPVAMALSRFVRNNETKPPLTLAISGVWGSGKSSLMNLVFEDLKARNIRPAWFNAWHHQKEEHLLAALLENVRDQATPPMWTLSGLRYRLRLLPYRMRELGNAALLALAVLGGAALLLLLGVETLGEKANLADLLSPSFQALGVPTGVLTLIGLAGFLASRLGLAPATLLASVRGNASLGQLSGQLSFRQRFAREFNHAAKVLRVGSDAGLVIFIDDLDRCSPANLMELLEAVNFLATAGPCFIFLGMDEARVVEAIATQAPIKDTVARAPGSNEPDRDAAREEGRRYLHKLINVTIPVPEATLEGTLKIVAEDPPEPPSPWPDRLRRFIRSAPDVVAPLAVAALLATWLGVETFEAQAAAQLRATEAAAAAAARDNLSGEQARPSGKAAAASSGSAPDAAPPTQAASPSLEATEAAAAPSDAPRSEGVPAWLLTVLAIAPLAVAALVAFLFLARRAVVVAYDQEEDSAGFRSALEVWHPLVYSTDATPRGVKRHQNRIRLQAMLLRGLEEPADWLDRLLKRPGAEGRSGVRAAIADELLVALAALEEARLLDEALADQLPPPPTSRPAVTREEVAAAALARFKAQFGSLWPPSPTQRQAYRSMHRAFTARG